MDTRTLETALDWEVGVYRAIRALWRWAVPGANEAPIRPGAAELAPHQGRLECLARWVAGARVRVLIEPRGLGGRRGQDLLLPARMDLADDVGANLGLAVLRTVVAAHWAGSGRRVPSDPATRFRAELDGLAAAVCELQKTYHAFGEAWVGALTLEERQRPAPGSQRAALEDRLRYRAAQGVAPGEDDWSAWTKLAGQTPGAPWRLWGTTWPDEVGGATDGVHAPTGEDGRPDTKPTSEAVAPRVEELRRVLLDPRGEDKVVQHTFEKVETLDSYEGNALRADGADELDDELEALEEVPLGALVRGGPPAQALLRAELGGAGAIPDVEHVDPAEQGKRYPEWDYRQGRLLPDWCTVYPADISVGRPGQAALARQEHRALIEALHGRLLALRAARAWVDRQREGEQPDLAALVDRAAEVAAGRTGTERIYLRQVPRRRRLATTVLLDVSLSADSWVAERRVLEVARAAVFVLGEVADRLDDRLEILAFATQTRHRCRVWRLKRFDERWAPAAPRIFALEPQGYTRIGAPLRHATAGLLAAGAERRLLLMVGDGKPTDYDRYEGRHGLGDVRHAVSAAEAAGVHVFALAVDPGARSTLPAMFGPGRWQVMNRPAELVGALAGIYAQLTAAC